MKNIKFKDSVGRWFTISLFKELARAQDNILFTLDEARNLYLGYRDVTGFIFANKHLGGWRHWKALQKSPPVSAEIREWEDELEVMLRSESLLQIHNIAKTDKGYQAAKFLVDKGWRDKTVGRRTKDQIAKEGLMESKMYDEFTNVVGIKG